MIIMLKLMSVRETRHYYFVFSTPVESLDVLWEPPWLALVVLWAGLAAGSDVHFLIRSVLLASTPSLVTMFVVLISQEVSINHLIDAGTRGLWPLI